MHIPNPDLLAERKMKGNTTNKYIFVLFFKKNAMKTKFE